ncbi:hypothetical protein Agub_g5817, partial [Astrephomene gubernaculifera]
EARLKKQLQEGRVARAARQVAAVTGQGAAEGGGGGGGEAASMDVDSAAPQAGAAAAAGGSGGNVDNGGTRAAAPAAAVTSGRCYYTALSRLVKGAGLTPAQLTALNLDRTAQLEAAAQRWGDSGQTGTGT